MVPLLNLLLTLYIFSKEESHRQWQRDQVSNESKEI